MATAKQTERREKLARNINTIMEAYGITIIELAAELTMIGTPSPSAPSVRGSSLLRTWSASPRSAA